MCAKCLHTPVPGSLGTDTALTPDWREVWRPGQWTVTPCWHSALCWSPRGLISLGTATVPRLCDTVDSQSASYVKPSCISGSTWLGIERCLVSSFRSN